MPRLRLRDRQPSSPTCTGENEKANRSLKEKIRLKVIGSRYWSGFHIGVLVNRTRMTRVERIDADLFWFYPR
jgi:hypothetical protein